MILKTSILKLKTKKHCLWEHKVKQEGDSAGMVLIAQRLPLKTRGMVDSVKDIPSMLDQRETEIVIHCIQIRGHLHNLHKLSLGVLDVNVTLVHRSSLIVRRSRRYKKSS